MSATSSSSKSSKGWQPALVENGSLIGIVSNGDQVRWIIATQRMTIDQLEKYIAGGYPG